MTNYFITQAVVMGVLSVVAFFAFGLDKWRAKKEAWRIPEKTLHLLSVLGGWPGALLGQRMFRHKTVKLSFRVVLWICVCVHIALVSSPFFLGWFDE